MVTNPDWVEKPTGDELVDVFPAAAQLLGIPGRVLLGCRVAISGDLEACGVLDETPKGEGFGAAALLITPRFKMRPMTRDGVAVAGARVNIPITFALADDGLPAAPMAAPTAASEPSTRAMALAERIVTAFGHEDMAPIGLAGFAQTLDRVARAQIGDPQQAQNRDAAVADLYQAWIASEKALHRARVVAFARTFSEDEMAGIADFLETAAGRAFVAKGQEGTQRTAAEMAAVVREATAAARREYCAARDCGPALSHAPAPK